MATRTYLIFGGIEGKLDVTPLRGSKEGRILRSIVMLCLKEPGKTYTMAIFNTVAMKVVVVFAYDASAFFFRLYCVATLRIGAQARASGIRLSTLLVLGRVLINLGSSALPPIAD